MLSRIAITGLLLLACPHPTPAQPASTPLSAEARELLAQTNQDRAAQRLGPLAWSRELAQAATLHDARMVERNDLEHQFAGEADVATRTGQAGAHFRSVAENIAIGPNAEALEREWMHSPRHRANILDPRMNTVGIALVRHNGQLWAVEDFAQSVESLTAATAERRVINLLTEQGLSNAKVSESARQTCELEHGSAGGTRPGFIMRWEGSDLSRLPDVLLEKLHTGRFRSAAVGVCRSAAAAHGFTAYRVAVLLY